jgi:hypothetical protein
MNFLKPWLQKVIILALKNKMVLLITPLFDLEVDFGVFDKKKKVFDARVFVLRSHFLASR